MSCWQREAQTLQRARLHVLERAHRWKEAYNYGVRGLID
jgi:hypothetical protein